MVINDIENQSNQYIMDKQSVINTKLKYIGQNIQSPNKQKLDKIAQYRSIYTKIRKYCIQYIYPRYNYRNNFD